MAKKHLKLKVLGIGDGYNDTLMLQASDVGFRIRPENPNQSQAGQTPDEQEDLEPGNAEGSKSEQ